MEGMAARTPSRDNMGEAGRHNMLSALPPPPVPLGVPFFNQPPLSGGPYGHLAPLPRKLDTPPLPQPPPPPPPPQPQPSPPPRPPQPALDITRTPLDVVRAQSPLQQLEPVRAPSPLPQPLLQPEPPKRTVQVYRKRQHDGSEARPHDVGASHLAGMLVHPEGDIPNLPPRSGTGLRLRPARLPPCSCIPPPAPEPLASTDPVLLQVLRMHDQRRVVNPAQVANVVVYDCVERPPSAAELANAGSVSAPAAAAGAAAGAGAGAAERGGAESETGCVVNGSGRAGSSDGSLRGTSSSGAGAGGLVLGGRGSGEGGGQGRTGAGDSSPRGSTASGEAGSAAGGGEAAAAAGAAAADAGCRGAAGPPSCSYGRADVYDYFEDMPAWYRPRGPSDHTLVFESRFESGNLRRAIQVYPYEYDLILRPDINTRGHTQWFFFSVANTRAGCRYKFNIINLLKEDSLYNDGMQPLIHSAKTQAGRGLGWHRSGSRICYYANNIRRGRGKTYFTLTFTLTTEYDNDLVHVAHCYPYTYTDLQRYIRSLELDPLRRHQLRRETLAVSLAGNAVDLLTITSPTVDLDALKRRKAVVVTARVHPGESNASWMMKGVLDFLMGPSLDARMLRDAFVFKIIPMLNPDGVITGNYRCSLAGVDLNRVWNDPSRKLHPVIYATKLFLKQLSEEREVAMFCDLHGHSRKRGVFMYGCEKKLPRDATPLFPGLPLPGTVGGQANIPQRFQEKLLPLLIQYNAPDLFAYQNCSFKVQKSKSGTSRVVGFRELGLVNSFTVEASFAGPVAGRWARQHFTTSHLEQQGAALMTALLDYWDPEAYGYGELLGQLEFLHPANGEAPPRFITTPEGQLVELEDDEPPTDSDDDSSDEDAAGGSRGGAGRARTATNGRRLQLGPGAGALSRDAQGSAFMQQYYNTYGMPVDMAGGLGARAQPLRPGELPGDKMHSDSEQVVVDPKKAKRRARLAMQKALLRAEQAKATEGLAACLPMMAALQVQSPTGAAAAEAEANRRASNGESVGHDSRFSSFSATTGAGAGAANPGSGARGTAARGLPSPATPHAIEYAKQRGVYRGDAPQWTVPGLNAAYDVPESAASSPPSPSQPPPRPQSPSRAAAGRLAASTNAFNAMLMSQSHPSVSNTNASAGGGGVIGSAFFINGGTVGGGSTRPMSPGLSTLVNGGARPPVSPLPVRAQAYAAPAKYGGGGVLAAAAAAAAAQMQPLTPPSGREDAANAASQDAGGGGGGGGSGGGWSGPLASGSYIRPSSGTAAPSSASTAVHAAGRANGTRSAPRTTADAVPSAGPGARGPAAAAVGGATELRAATAPAPRPRPAIDLAAAAAGLELAGENDQEGEVPSPSSSSTAASYSDPERLRRDREALQLRVTEAVLTTSPLFQRL